MAAGMHRLAFALLLACASCLAGPAARAAEAAAVPPTTGELPVEVRRALTIELRRDLSRRGYQLVPQEQVRQTAAFLPAAGLPHGLDLARIGEALSAELVVAATVEMAADKSLVIAAIGHCRRRGIIGPVLVPLRPAGPALTRRDIAGCAEDLIEALLVAPPTVTSPTGARAAEEPLVVGGERQPVDMERHDEGEWHFADHAGFFVDLSFIFSWCTGDLLCSATGTGYGGRLRLGYRIASYVAVSATAVFAGHDLPTSRDLEALARTERSLGWYGFHGGLRGHPVNRSWFDPFVGIDLGWTRLHYYEKVEGDTGNCDPDYMGIDMCQFTTVRNGLSMDGFTVTPQLGINFFVTRNVALGVVAEFLIPLWSKACNEFTVSALGQSTEKESHCVDIEDADSKFIALENGSLDELAELPRHFNLELHLSFSF